MSGDFSGELSSLTEALKAAQVEKTEAYVQSDWHRVWELSNKVIPKLEREIAALTGSQIGTEDQKSSPLQPLDFEWLLIELVESENSFINIHIRRQPSRLKHVKVFLVFSRLQKQIVEKHLLDHPVFYGAVGDIQVTVADLVKGVWTSEPMSDEDADKTAENARDGINDLRLILQERARHAAG